MIMIMITVGFEPTIPAREWPQTYAFCLILMLSVIELCVLVDQEQYTLDCLSEVQVQYVARREGSLLYSTFCTL